MYVLTLYELITVFTPLSTILQKKSLFLRILNVELRTCLFGVPLNTSNRGAEKNKTLRKKVFLKY